MLPAFRTRTAPVARLLVVLVLLTSACREAPPEASAPAPPPLWAPTPEAPTLRLSDGLLDSPELQAVVDLQHAGDTRGLVRLLGAQSPAVRARAAFSLASAGDDGARAALTALLSDPEPSVRAGAAFALGALGGADLGEPLAGALAGERDPAVREALIEALGRLGTRAAAETLLALDPLGDEAVARAWALSRLGGPGGVELEALRDRLIEDLTASDPALRAASAYFFRTHHGLGQWISRSLYLRLALDDYARDEPAAMHLVKGLGLVHDVLNGSRLRDWAVNAHDWRTRADALSGLDPMSASAPILIDAIDDPAPNVAVAAAERLGRDALGEGFVPRVESFVRENPDRLGVVGPLLSALAQIDRSAPVAAWVESTDPGDEGRWRVALEVISYMSGPDAIRLLLLGLDDPSDRTAGRAVGALVRRWENDREAPETHEAYLSVFESAAGHRLPEVAARAREILSRPPLRAAALERGIDLSPPAGGDQAAARVQADDRVDWGFLASLGSEPRLVLETTRGRVVVRLAPLVAPLTVQTVARLTGAGHYDGVPFHRVVPNFVVQTGDFTAGDGTGDPGFGIPLERSGIPFERGVVGMAARTSDGVQASQFMILHSRQLELDGDFTAFGWVVEGWDVVDSIELFDVVVDAAIER